MSAFSTAPWLGQVLMNVDFQPDYSGDDHRRPVDSVDEANVATSIATDIKSPFGAELHRPVLDIDVPLVAIPSSTPGHWHLYIDKPMSWTAYRRLLLALAEAGIVETGYADAAISRGQSAVRLPWVRK